MYPQTLVCGMQSLATRVYKSCRDLRIPKEVTTHDSLSRVKKECPVGELVSSRDRLLAGWLSFQPVLVDIHKLAHGIEYSKLNVQLN